MNRINILKKISEIAREPNPGSFICFMSSHGDLTSLACSTGRSVKYSEILDAADTMELEKHPKIFFFDACRKYQYDILYYDN